MTHLREYFPYDATFEPPISAGLEAEKVCKAFFILNLTAPPDARHVEQCAVIYSTNWGEMFCRTFDRPGESFEKHASSFLARQLSQPLHGEIELNAFIPKGSQCARIALI
ncbi:hypothetical protein [Pseudodesulfovibrio tunisiensis]|uniref:hypothetical protein n=1 Tax=Pseudodesulfovibrio tunisiensis TaxID=463192 RepID=UPI001FB26CD1|nr:hypothetical protein [Pseudodesulfovibrio tunisiensis]